MNEIKGQRLYVALGASKVRRRLKGHGLGVRKVYCDGTSRAVIIHTATGEHLRRLESLFQDVLTTPTGSEQPRRASTASRTSHLSLARLWPRLHVAARELEL